MVIIKTGISKYLQQGLFAVFFLLVWEILARSGIFPSTVFPGFTAVWAAFINGIRDGLLMDKTLYTLWLIVQGMFVTLVLALGMSFLANGSSLAENLVDTLNAVFHPLPGIALLPVVILWFGMGEASLLIIIIHSVIWPMVVNFNTGFRSIPPLYMELGRNFGLDGFKLLWGIMLPASLPYLLSGIKIGWARAWRAAIAAEMVFGAAAGAAGGLGWHIYMTRYLFDVAGTFAALLAIVIVGLSVEELVFGSIERLTVKKWGLSG